MDRVHISGPWTRSKRGVHVLSSPCLFVEKLIFESFPLKPQSSFLNTQKFWIQRWHIVTSKRYFSCILFFSTFIKRLELSSLLLRIFKDFHSSRQITRMKEFKLQISIWYQSRKSFFKEIYYPGQESKIISCSTCLQLYKDSLIASIA